jgi:DNA modification methylase
LATNDGQIEGLPKNPRQIRDHRYEKLKKSIEDAPEMLQLRELLVFPHGGKFVIIGGNMRYRACKELGYKELPCKVLDAETPVEKLRQYAIKDNENFGEYDWDIVANEWDTAEMEDWGVELPTDWGAELEGEGIEQKEIVEDEIPENVETKCKKGEIWQLGDHRLFVGDCTIEDNISRLMDGNRADITFTSPPYNMCSNNIQNIFKSEKIKKSYDIQNGTYNEFNDALNDEQYSQLLIDALKNALKFSDDALFNIGILQGSKNGIIEMLKAFQNNFCDILIWNKNNSLPMGMSSMHGAISHRCELIFCFNQKGTRRFTHPQWDEHGTYKGSPVINRIDTGSAANNEYAKEHHATFPVEFAAEVLKLYSESSVLELFGGTGTTLIAAEQLNRRCFICELDPHYCDIILARWEKLSGGTAVKIEDV